MCIRDRSNTVVICCVEVVMSVTTMSIKWKAFPVSGKLEIQQKHYTTLNQIQLADLLGI